MQSTIFQRHPVLKDILNISIFIVAVLIGNLIINTYIFRSFSVVGPSMEKTMYTNDRLIVNRLPIAWAQLQNKTYVPERGQIVIFKNPHYISGLGDEFVVKRVIAFTGEHVVLKSGHYTVFNSQFPNGFDPDDANKGEPGSPTSGEVDMVVPENEMFISGDHRQDNYSLDSRNGLGTIPYTDIVGPVELRIFPFNKLRAF